MSPGAPVAAPVRPPVCFVTDDLGHPTLAEAADRLRRAGPVLALDPADEAAVADHLATVGPERGEREGPAPLYLLKAHTAPALRLATALEERGARVVNPTRPTALCRDRWQLTEALVGAGVAVPPWTTAPTLTGLVARAAHGAPPALPWVVKSRFSRRQELVQRVDDRTRLDALVEEWGDEPVLAQALVPNDGWDVKLWIFGPEVLAARRRTALEDGHRDTTTACPGPLPDAWLDVAGRIGRHLGLLVYGVDLVIGPDGPVVVDVNAFPGARGIDGSADSLARLVGRLTRS